MTTSGDGKLRLWDIASGKLIGSPLPGATTGGWGTSFPDGKHAISVFADGTGVVWNVDPAAWEDAGLPRRSPQPHAERVARLPAAAGLSPRLFVTKGLGSPTTRRGCCELDSPLAGAFMLASWARWWASATSRG